MYRLLADAPADASLQLAQLEDGELLSYLICLPSSSFLSDWFVSNDISAVIQLFGRLTAALEYSALHILSESADRASLVELVSSCRFLLILTSALQLMSSIVRGMSERLMTMYSFWSVVIFSPH